MNPKYQAYHDEIAAIERGEVAAARVTRVEKMPDGLLRHTELDPEKDRQVRAARFKNALPARAAAGMKQTEFAARLGISQTTLANWEQGATKPKGPAARLLQLLEKRPELLHEMAS